MPPVGLLSAALTSACISGAIMKPASGQANKMTAKQLTPKTLEQYEKLYDKATAFEDQGTIQGTIETRVPRGSFFSRKPRTQEHNLVAPSVREMAKKTRVTKRTYGTKER